MKILKLISASMILIISGCSTEAPSSLQVNKTMQINAGLESVWGYAGDFCAIGTWHPAVENCELTEEDGTTFRLLTLGDGAQLKEKHNSDMPAGYAYSIVEGPLPVKDYSATFQAEGDAESTTITWAATFLAKGATDDEATEVIAGIFDGGLASISSNFEQ